jgi:hypothetical protein
MFKLNDAGRDFAPVSFPALPDSLFRPQRIKEREVLNPMLRSH